MITVHSDTKYLCEVCNKPFKRKDLLERHMKIHSAESDSFNCKICLKTFQLERNLKGHMKIHDDARQRLIFECEKCAKQCFNKKSFENHLLQGHSENPAEKRSCEVCGKPVGNHYYKQHLKSHDNSRTKPQCDICHKKFVNFDKLQQHFTTHLKDSCKVKCEVCDKKINSRNMKEHLKTHDSLRYNCEQCGKDFSRKEAVNRHVLTIHDKDQAKFPCNVCAKKFRRRDYMMEHVRLVHQGTKQVGFPT